MFAKVRNYKKTCLLFWVTSSLLIWLLSAASGIIFLTKWRALEALKQAVEHKEALSQAQIQSLFQDITSWIVVSSHLGMDLKNRAILPDLTGLMESCLENRPNIRGHTPFECPECSPEVKNWLAKLALMLEQDDRYQAQSELIENQIMALKDLKNKIINFHYLLAKDLANLTGTSPLYETNAKKEILYYKSGPFKWLPLLDTSNPVVPSQEALEVEDFSRQLNLLRNHSYKLVLDFEDKTKDLEKNELLLNELQNLRLIKRSEIVANTVQILETVIFTKK